jgi:hypothetical protein
VLYRRTEWFRVRTSRGIEGWASQKDMRRTLLADGSAFTFDLGDRAGFTRHNWEMGVQAGDYGGATLVSAYLSRAFNEQMALEVTGSQFLGNASNGYTAGTGRHPRDPPGLAHLALPHAGHRHHLDQAQVDAGAAG